VHERVALIAAALSNPQQLGRPLPDCDGVGARVIFSQPGDAGAFAYISAANQPWPFVAGADERLLTAGQRDKLELLEMIGFEQEWVQQQVAQGVQFRMVIFALEDCGGI
jgi:hypothetical protein